MQQTKALRIFLIGSLRTCRVRFFETRGQETPPQSGLLAQPMRALEAAASVASDGATAAPKVKLAG